MSDLPRFWTEPFLRQVTEALGSDDGFQKAARKFEQRFVMRCLDTPDGKDIRVIYQVNRGQVDTQMIEVDAPAAQIRDEDFDKDAAWARFTAPYEFWCRLDRGEVNVLQALASPDYRIEGSKIKIMANIGVLNAMQAVIARLPKSY